MTKIPEYTKVRVISGPNPVGLEGTILEGPYFFGDYYLRIDGTDQLAFVRPEEVEVISVR